MSTKLTGRPLSDGTNHCDTPSEGQQELRQPTASIPPAAAELVVVPARQGIRRDATEMLYWALRWHEGRRVSYRILGDLLWGEFAKKPMDPGPSLRELMVYVQARHGNDWAIDDCGRGFRISLRAQGTPAPGAPPGRRARRQNPAALRAPLS